MRQTDTTIVRDQQNDHSEEGIVVPLDRINPDTLQKLVEEFVTREWSELSDDGYSMDDKIKQVLQQLKENRARVVYDLTSETCNIVPVSAASIGTPCYDREH